jgi:flagellar protein FlaI
MDGDANKRADEALRVSLRLGESAIVLGEVRGDETRTLYQSMRTGRAGSSIMGTIHGDSSKTVYERVVHDLQIAPEAFMATDFLITMGTVRLRGSDKQTRMVSEMVSTSEKIGSFIDITADTGLFRSPAIKRIMKSTGMTKKDIIEEIGIRAEMRSFLAEMAQSHGVGFYGAEWIALANDHLGKCISSGTMEKDEVMDSFRNRFKRFSKAI